MADVKIKKLRPEDWSVNEDAAAVNLGFDLSRRSIIRWNMGESKNLLLAGYGVRQTEWELAAITRHAKHHGVAVYGQDFSSFMGNFPKNTFKQLVTEQDGAQLQLEKLAVSDERHVLVITALNHLLAPAYISEDRRNDEPRRVQALLDLLVVEMKNPAANVVITASMLHEEAALPLRLLREFSTQVLTSKIFARDLKHLLREDQDSDLVSKIVRDMNAGNSVLLDGSAQEFENFRPGR